MQQLRPFTPSWAPQLNRFELHQFPWSLFFFERNTPTQHTKRMRNGCSTKYKSRLEIRLFECLCWRKHSHELKQMRRNERVISLYCVSIVAIKVTHYQYHNESWMYDWVRETSVLNDASLVDSNAVNKTIMNVEDIKTETKPTHAKE